LIQVSLKTLRRIGIRNVVYGRPVWYIMGSRIDCCRVLIEKYGLSQGRDSGRTIEAARAIYAELAGRSVQREGVYYPLSLSTTLVVSGTATTLDGAIDYFVTT
jgi:hypothetical protein